MERRRNGPSAQESADADADADAIDAEAAQRAAVQARESAIDRRDADALYRELEEEIIPAYDQRGGRWFGMMRASIALAERFSSDRMVRDYFRRLYVSEPSPRPVLSHDARQETSNG
jgi:hypothetical protein